MSYNNNLKAESLNEATNFVFWLHCIMLRANELCLLIASIKSNLKLHLEVNDTTDVNFKDTVKLMCFTLSPGQK
jgi:hypothetical protein